MTQTPQQVPAGWYPSPDGAPVQRWWDGVQWTVATDPPLPAPPSSDAPLEPSASAEPSASVESSAPAEPGPAVSGWPAPDAPRLGPLSLATRIFVALAGVAAPLAAGAHLWRTGTPPEWLTEDAALTASGTAAGLLVVAALFWLVWQARVAATHPPGTPRRSVGWQVGSWLIPVGSFWMPYQNIADLFLLHSGRRPRWLPVWWVLWLAALTVSAFSALAPWLGLAGGVLLLAATPLAWLVVSRLSATSAGGPQSRPLR
ncbi:MAG: DUF4328 domain-containing protein [Propionibacteriaceae bacterium]|nr:DUF4328 domain-containing protein [Propionibacteriaceae bacterium]